MQTEILQMTRECFSPAILEQEIYPDLDHSYYWSNDWSPEFYFEAAYAGCISITHKYSELQYLLLPEIQTEYAVLDWHNLHISRKVERLIRTSRYTLKITDNIREAQRKIADQYGDSNWFTEQYAETLVQTSTLQVATRYTPCAIFLMDYDTIVGGEIGYFLGKTYTSLSGFSSKEKQYRNCGTLQLAALARLLESLGCSFWNLGHPHLEYKIKLGAADLSRKDFLDRWIPARNSMNEKSVWGTYDIGALFSHSQNSNDDSPQAGLATAH